MGLSQKDQYIHHLSNKLQRLEFNSREAIVLLSDAVSDDNASQLGELHGKITLSLNFLRQAQQTATPAADPPEVYDPVEVEDFEEGELERRAAAVNEWRKRDDPDVSAWDRQALNLMDGVESTVEERSSTDTSRHTANDADSIQASSGHSAGVAGTGTTFSSATSVSSMTRLPSSEDGSVLPRPPSDASRVPLPVDSTFCTNCKQLLTQLDQQIEQKAYLKRDLSSLASALSEEEQLRASIEQVKEELEEDVQEITAMLFKTLNAMLMDEVNDREGLVRLDKETGGKLAQVLQAWDTREERLRTVKEHLVDLDAAVDQSSHVSERLVGPRPPPNDDYETTTAITPRISMARLKRFSSAAAPSSPLVALGDDENLSGIPNRTVRLDGLVFNEFQQHLKALSSAPASSTAMPATAYMKRVMTEDIDPCLFQYASASWWKSPWFKRKLIDAIANNRCEIQSYANTTHTVLSASTTSSSPATSHISTSSASTPITAQPAPNAPKTKCTCCGHLRICEFRMRLQPQQKQPQQQPQAVPWLPIDRFCRDRIVAVCDFYNFMSHLKQGLMHSSPVLHMFKQSLHFRRRMGVAKVGSISLFEDDPRHYSSSSKRRSRSKRESIVLDHSGSASDSGSVVSVSDIQGLNGTGQIVIVH